MDKYGEWEIVTYQIEKNAIAIGRAMQTCKTLVVNIDDHFREVTKMNTLAKGAQREVQDFMFVGKSPFG